MCGIAGLLGFSGQNADRVQHIAGNMANAIAHRGPDDAGVWLDEGVQIALAHRRLSILDLSPAGHQPMVSASGRFVIAFNGEIYNHLKLRAELEKFGATKTWLGHSDTETLLASIQCWGVAAALQKAVGMFAFALWDRETRKLILARDRMGEKPLYYGWQEDVFLFGSELKALRAYPNFKGEIDRDAITLLLRHNYIPTPYSIYRGVYKLKPGNFLEIRLGDRQALAQPEPYWSLVDIVASGQNNPFAGDEREATDTLENLLKNTVGGQMMADVSLGAFLSGGIDSSMVVALMQAQSALPIKTFTIGFNEEGYNEAVHAKAIARHLGTEHTELYVTPEQALAVIPRLPTLYDEPFSDSSQIPTFLVSELTRQHVTVSLSGDGGDELFGGYNRYFGTQSWWGRIEKIPAPIRHLMANGPIPLTLSALEQIGGALTTATKNRLRWGNLENRVAMLAEILTVNDGRELYRHFITHWPKPDRLVMGGIELPTQVTHPTLELNSIVEQMMMLDTLSYLPDDILCKVDRAAMGVSLETRVPMLDHRVIEFAWHLPLSMKVRGGKGKWILREVLNRYVPKELTERPKMGFGVPIDSWLQGPLRDWAEALLDESRLRQEGFFNPAPIRQKWAEHLCVQRNWQYHLWDILMFQAWLEQERAQ